MKGKAGPLPRGDQWVYELKWDGMRIIAFIDPAVAEPDGAAVRLQSSNGRDVTASFPELQALAGVSAHFDGIVLDGEVVAFAGAKPSFGVLQTRMHVTDPTDAARRAHTTPVVYVAFDLLHMDGHDTMTLPLSQRRALLEQLADDDPSWTICDQHLRDPDGLIDAVAEAGLEGVMAKRAGSSYSPGSRSSDWVKIKPRRRQEFVVGGWLRGQGNRSGGLGSLLVGYYDGTELRYAGRAGSGLTDATQQQWRSLLVDSTMCPFATSPTFPRDKVVQWCQPDHVVEIAFAEWAGDGHHLRHPVVLGRRSDKDPRSVVRES